MRFRKLISGTCRVDAGEWLDTDEDSAWYAGLREAVQRCRDDDDTRHVAYEDFDAAGRALVDNGVARILTAMEDSAFVPRWCRLSCTRPSLYLMTPLTSARRTPSTLTQAATLRSIARSRRMTSMRAEN